MNKEQTRKTPEHYENGFMKTRISFSALAKRIREGDLNPQNVEYIKAIKKTVEMDCRRVNTEYIEYLQVGGDGNNEDYAQLGVLGPTILRGLQGRINSKIEDTYGDQ